MFEKINHCLILCLLPVFLLGACTGINVSETTVLSVEASDVSMSDVTVNLVVTGELPSSCRVAPPVLKSVFDATAATDEELCAYLDENGYEVSLPTAIQFTNLRSSSDYLVVSEWTSAEQRHYRVGQFKTLASADLSFSLTMEGNLWKKGVKAGIVSYDRIETKNENVAADFNYSVSDKEAVFIPSAELQIPSLGMERFYVYYPYNENIRLNESDFCVHSVVPDNQTSDGNQDLTCSWAICDITNNTTNVSLNLKKALCRIDFNINLSEYPNYGLRKLSLFDSQGNAKLSGEYAVDPEKEIVKAVSNSAKSNVTAINGTLSFDGKISFTLIPGDYRQDDLILIVYLENSLGETHIVPVRYSGEPLNLNPGDCKTVNIESLKSSENPYPWFEYNDSRDFLDGVAYGAQNTWCVESGGSVTFDVKARGDVLKASAPKYYGIMLESNLKGIKLLSLPDGTDTYEPTPSRPVPSDYKITVNCLSGNSASFGVVAIYDSNFNVLWSYMIWKYEPGDPISFISYEGISEYKYMDRALGARRSIAVALADGKALEGAAYFNWGRKDPFPWKNQVPTHYLTEVGDGHDMQYTISHPNVKMLDSNSSGNWCDNQRKDLWGAENKTTSDNRNLRGHKTIYDPCPEGYRVPDYDALCCVSENKILAEIEFNTSDKRYSLQHDGTHLTMACPFSDMSAFAIKKTDGNYDYWLYHGNLWADSGWSNATTDANKAGYCYWSNSNQNTTNYKASIIRGWYNGAGTKWFYDTADRMAGGYPVRCQKEN